MGLAKLDSVEVEVVVVVVVVVVVEIGVMRKTSSVAGLLCGCPPIPIPNTHTHTHTHTPPWTEHVPAVFIACIFLLPFIVHRDRKSCLYVESEMVFVFIYLFYLPPALPSPLWLL